MNTNVPEPATATSSFEGSIVVDSLGFLLDQGIEGAGYGDGRVPPDVTPRLIADARAANLTAMNTTIGYVFGSADPFELTVREMRQWDEIIARFPNDLVKVSKAADILRAKTDNRIGIVYGFQNSDMLMGQVENVDFFAEAGARVIQLTYNTRNAVGSGAVEKSDPGLTEFGREVIERMNQLGIVIDLSHSAETTCLDAIDHSRQPVAITHTGCAAIVNTPRNKTDDELRRVADAGGYVGIYFMPFLTSGRNAMGDDLIAHIEHAIRICGEDHVGLGTDNSCTPPDDMDAYRQRFLDLVEQRRRAGLGAPGERADIMPWVVDMVGKERFRDLYHRLERRGHSPARLEKLFGLNFVRFAGEVWGG